mmetsp:Transcript_13957/g.22912  ORF Transcript_13957/g.22912 Transcript_13957/m.22912 type:complete len:95 (+) Transcript_13957:14-298(+)
MTERIQWTHPKDQFDSYSPLPLDGIRFSPTSFDWDWDADEEALPTAATATDFSSNVQKIAQAIFYLSVLPMMLSYSVLLDPHLQVQGRLHSHSR